MFSLCSNAIIISDFIFYSHRIASAILNFEFISLHIQFQEYYKKLL